MFSHVKSMLWLLVSVSFCLAAALTMLDFANRQELAFDDMAGDAHGQRHSVFTRGNDQAGAAEPFPDDTEASEQPETYTAQEILYSLPEWASTGTAVEVNGTPLAIVPRDVTSETLEQSRKLAMALLDLQAEYVVRRNYDSSGNIANIFFTGK
ncbi:hypothetical protein [Paenibacillus macerans]|uniref:hypothetical protein n=1 Tax=Paenibacillus macerans TaxID=44252 RepID=UPI003D32275E